MSTSITGDEFKAAMASFAAGVTVVTTLDAAGKPHALTATAFSSLSAEPPLCLVCVDKRSRTHAPLVARKHFAVNILSSHQRAVSARFAGTDDDKFTGVAWSAGRMTGCPVIHDALATLECEVQSIYEGGDHDIFVGRLVAVQVRKGDPLVYFRGNYLGL
jgi:flavin reductase (DIM6/NTAB) family NADH-FMN oxidoreductase RutF